MSVSPQQPLGRRGFTLLELLVVISVIAALAAVGLPTINYMRHKAQVAATEAVVKQVAMTISVRQERHHTIDDGSGNLVTFPIWDVNDDGLLDGNPEKEQPVLAADRKYPAVVLAEPEPYRGFINTVSFEVAERHVDELGRVVDAWRQPLRIAYGAGAYGSLGIGVWSIGDDGVDGFATGHDGTDDDITSWKLEGAQ